MEPEWATKALAELDAAEQEYEIEKLKENLITSISKMSHEQRVTFKKEMENI